MYTLYYLPEACSLATQVVLLELGQKVTLINKNEIDDFNTINPVGTVPVLIDQERTYTEGAAILIHLLKKHPNQLLPESGNEKHKAIENILFANATMHPAYSKLFFIAQNIQQEDALMTAYKAATDGINHLWSVVENRLTTQPYLGGDKPSAADILLTVYSRWGDHFPVQIEIGEKTQNMIEAVKAMPNFVKALANEHALAKPSTENVE